MFSRLRLSVIGLPLLLLTASHSAQAQTYTAGAGLTLTGNQFSIANGGVTGAMIGLPLALTASSSNPILTVTNTGSGYGVKTVSASGTGTYGTNTKYGNVGTLGDINGFGVYGSTAAGPYPYGVYGINRTSGNGDYGILGGVASINGSSVPVGVFGSDTSAAGQGIYGSSAHGTGVFASSGGTSVNNPGLHVSNTSSSGIGIYSVTNSSDANLVLTNAGTGDLIKAFNGGNNLYFEVKANGSTVVRQLQITGGADLAEPYTVASLGSITPQPGMVVAIDPDHTGQMTLAHRTYDRTVAGIISGAGGIAPGLTLRQSGTVADGTLPVACSGRVWCFCDADADGAITPGDLLTTSGTPGHAMKAADDHSVRGAILGKAMSSLPSGKGLVLVLVTLE